MINTKCSECMFAKPIINNDPLTGCSKNIIEKIHNVKKIFQEPDSLFNTIENYTCRHGFSNKIYEEHKDKFEGDTFDKMIQSNSKFRYYLLLDCSDNTIDFDNIISSISQLDIKPSAISFIFRSVSFRPFLPEKHNDICNSLFNDIKWKAHNFLYNISLNSSIDHILSTNSRMNDTSHFLVYDSNRIDTLNNDTINANNNIMLYQKPMVVMTETKTDLHKFCMSFENYSVAKQISSNLLGIYQEINEADIIYF
jgi:hypothetical protein